LSLLLFSVLKSSRKKLKKLLQSVNRHSFVVRAPSQSRNPNYSRVLKRHNQDGPGPAAGDSLR